MSRQIAALWALALLILGLAACESSGSASGGGSESRQHARVKLGLPF